MKHRFVLEYEIDCPVAIAVAVYLDAEHYVFLHKKYSDTYEVLRHDLPARKIFIRESWELFGLRIGQTCMTEYIPPATFLNYDVRPYPWWLPSIHHIMKSHTKLVYTEIPERNATLSTLEMELDMPFWLYPLRRWIQKAIERLKIEKDEQDIEMIKRRAALFGRENNSIYLADHQFILHKEDYLRHFGPNSTRLMPAPAATR
jgi:hypothetical protein